MDKALLESIAKMVPKGNILVLPVEKLSNYPAVKKCLITAGGKYKACTFIFPDDAAEVQKHLLGGEAVNDKKKFQFFATPPELACRLVEMAEVMAFQVVLEPSAGQGAIADEILCYGGKVHCIELMPQNCAVLRRKGFEVQEMDFLSIPGEEAFDRIVANPPFTKNQDIDHIRHMYTHLAPEGRIVTCASLSWSFGSQKKQVAFKAWLMEVGAVITELEGGEFKSSGTNIKACIITIDK